MRHTFGGIINQGFINTQAVASFLHDRAGDFAGHFEKWVPDGNAWQRSVQDLEELNQ